MTPGERFDAGEMVVKPDGLSIAVRNAGCSGGVFIAEVIGFVYELRYAATPDDDQTLVTDKATRTAKSGSGILLVEFACGTRQPRPPFRKTCGQSGKLRQEVEQSSGDLIRIVLVFPPQIVQEFTSGGFGSDRVRPCLHQCRMQAENWLSTSDPVCSP